MKRLIISFVVMCIAALNGVGYGQTHPNSANLQPVNSFLGKKVNLMRSRNNGNLTPAIKQANTIKFMKNETAKRRNLLLEVFASEANEKCPAIERTINLALEHATSLGMTTSLIFHHAGGEEDQFTNKWSKKAAPYFFKEQKPFVPAIAVDRITSEDGELAVDGTDAEKVIRLIDQDKDRVEFVEISHIEQSVENNQLNLHVMGRIYGTSRDLKLTAVLVESGLKSDKQKGVEGAYVHNNVARAFCTNAYGEELFIGRDNEFDLRLLECIDVDPSWNMDNMKIIVLVHRKLTNSISNRAVWTSKSEWFNKEEATHDVISTKTPYVYVVNNKIHLSGEIKSIEVYNLVGMKVADSASESLMPGMYIVRIRTVDNHFIAQKIQIQ